MPTFKIKHITKYTYENTVRDSASQIMLYPLEDAYQEIIKHKITITDNPTVEVHQDYFNNNVGTFTNAHPHSELIIDSDLIILTRLKPVPDDSVPAALQWQELDTLKSTLDFIEFLKQERFEALPEVRELISAERANNNTPLQSANHFSTYIFNNFAYQKGITTVETTLDEIWKLRSGVCQDFAHILLAMLRLMNIPARYVSGYICPNKTGMRGEGATHAWVEAYIPFFGWLGLDPTNNCVANDTHVRLAVGKNFTDCSPVKGTYRGTSGHTLEVAVSVSYEDGHTVSDENEVIDPDMIHTASRNSFRRHQEMQMQQ